MGRREQKCRHIGSHAACIVCPLRDEPSRSSIVSACSIADASPIAALFPAMHLPSVLTDMIFDGRHGRIVYDARRRASCSTR